jgi:hypothetical protein
MGGAHSTHRRDEKCIKNLVRKPEGEDNLEDLDMDGRVILQWILENSVGRCGQDSAGLK